MSSSTNSDFDKLEIMVDGATKGTGGGARLGGEPESSWLVTRKKSSLEPPLVCKYGDHYYYTTTNLNSTLRKHL